MRLRGILAVAFLLTAAAAASPDLVPLEIELPEPAFGGEPLSYDGPNLELPEVHFRNRPPFFAPTGTSNVAAGKPVSCSAPPIHGTPAQITDGDMRYRRDSVVELPGGLQWVQIDLKEEYNIYAILVWHFFENLRIYFSVIVQISNDKDFVDGVTTVFNNDFDDSSGFGAGKDKYYLESNKGRLIDTKGVSGRYVRLYSNGNHKDASNHYIEVNVYGRPGNADKPGGENDPEKSDTPDYVPIKIELPEPSFG